MHKKSSCLTGFLLIEALIYISLSAIFFLLLFQFLVYSYEKYKQSQSSGSKSAQIWVAQDLLIKDIKKASSDPSTWKLLPSDQSPTVIFSIEKTDLEISDYAKSLKSKELNNIIDIGWQIKNGNLYRTEGYYDKQTNKWKDKTESLVYTGINNFKIIINKSTNIKAADIQQKNIKIICIILEIRDLDKIKIIKKSICPRNGVINI